MKGPGLRLDLDVRRVWDCPACGRVLKTSGGVTQLGCDCRGEASPAMRLVEGRRRTESPFDHAAHAAQKRLDTALGRLPADPEECPDAPVPPESNLEQPPLNEAALADTIPQQPVPLATSSFADDPAVRAALPSDPPLPPSEPSEPAAPLIDPASRNDPAPGPGGV